MPELGGHSLGGGVFMLDDTNVDYAALQAESASAGRFRMDDSFEPDYSTFAYTSNDLYLQITGVTNGIASLVIHPPWNVTNGVYDLLYRTSPTPPDSWRFALHTEPGQTNLSVSNAVGRQGFYALGRPDSSQGTNFWLAFPNLANDGNDSLSLYISSAVSNSGTVTIPNQLNGPELIVTGSGEARVNGTYILTNEMVLPSLYELGPSVVTNAYTNGTLLVFFDEGYGWILADSSNTTVLYAQGNYVANDLNLNRVRWVDFTSGGLTPPYLRTFARDSL